MSHPAPWAFVLLALGAFRCVRLVAWDELTTPIRGWLTLTDATYDATLQELNDAIAAGVDPWETPIAPHFTRRRWYFAKLIRCAWCAGFWTALVVWAAWLAWPQAVVGAAVPFALSAVIGLVSKQLDP